MLQLNYIERFIGFHLPCISQSVCKEVGFYHELLRSGRSEDGCCDFEADTSTCYLSHNVNVGVVLPESTDRLICFLAVQFIQNSSFFLLRAPKIVPGKRVIKPRASIRDSQSCRKIVAGKATLYSVLLEIVLYLHYCTDRR